MSLRIAKEANLRGKYLTTYCSDLFNLIVFGDRFFVGSTFIPGSGWKVKISSVREGDEGLNLKLEGQLAKMNIVVQQRRGKQRSEKGGNKQAKKGDDTSTKEDQATKEARKPRTPYHRQWVADIIKPVMMYNPEMAYKEIKQALSLYGKEYVLTDSLLQDAKHVAREDLFGTAEQNAKYANGVVLELVAMGHHADLQFSSRTVVNSRMGKLILLEESVRCQTAGELQLEGAERNAFVAAWKEKHATDLDFVIGLSDRPQHQFLTGICFATLALMHTVGYLQRVVQADGAHMKIGKYTFFLAYSASANGNMSPIAFAILVGNEDTTNWTKFWQFVKQVSHLSFYYLVLLLPCI